MKPTRDLCVMACIFCRDPQFLAWVDYMAKQSGYVADVKATEADAKEFILAICEIQTRNDLDRYQEAAELFHENIRKPYLAWKEEHANT